VNSGETSDRLRADIDRGRTGDKVAVADPALAPLGTDEEAAGTPPSEAAVAQAHEFETQRGFAEPETPAIGDAWILIAFILLFALIVLIWGLASPL
jgi:hypothetical protein